jgi:hypothetical protein
MPNLIDIPVLVSEMQHSNRQVDQQYGLYKNYFKTFTVSCFGCVQTTAHTLTRCPTLLVDKIKVMDCVRNQWKLRSENLRCCLRKPASAPTVIIYRHRVVVKQETLGDLELYTAKERRVKWCGITGGYAAGDTGCGCGCIILKQR